MNTPLRKRIRRPNACLTLTKSWRKAYFSVGVVTMFRSEGFRKTYGEIPRVKSVSYVKCDSVLEALCLAVKSAIKTLPTKYKGLRLVYECVILESYLDRIKYKLFLRNAVKILQISLKIENVFKAYFLTFLRSGECCISFAYFTKFFIYSLKRERYISVFLEVV